MKSFIVLLLTISSVLFQCSETATERLCVAPLKGRVVSEGPACAGLAIQILSENFDSVRVDTLWSDAYLDNSPDYRNVFKTFPYCSVSTEQQEALLEAFEKKEEFLFIFASPPDDSYINDPHCTLCKPLVSLPESTNKILIVTEECKDQVTIEE